MDIRKGKKPLIILFVIFVVLLLSVLWTINRVGGYVGSLNVTDAFLCKELRQNVKPEKLKGTLQPNQKQVCIWFKYEQATVGDKLKISCYKEKANSKNKEKKLIAEKLITLTEKSGVRAFYLMRNNAKPLYAGKYLVVLSSETKTWYELPFEVVQAKIEQKPKPKTVVKKKEVKNKTKVKSGGKKRAKNEKSHSRKQQRRNTGRKGNSRRGRRR